MKKNKNFIKNILFLFIFGLVLFFLHFILYRFEPEIIKTKIILAAHPFLFVLTIISIFVMNKIFKKLKINMLGYVFLLCSMLKMALAVVFVFPTIRSDVEDKILFVVQFFIIYFFYLVWEVVIIYKHLKNSQK